MPNDEKSTIHYFVFKNVCDDDFIKIYISIGEITDEFVDIYEYIFVYITVLMINFKYTDQV